MPIDPADYHPDWPWMSRQIKAQAGDRCEWCGVEDRASVCASQTERDEHGWLRFTESAYWSEVDRVDLNGDDWFFKHWPDTGMAESFTKIVLTVHHQCDCDKRECRDPSHLVALCQRCHLNADRPHHLAIQAANRAARKEAELAAAGAVRLF